MILQGFVDESGSGGGVTDGNVYTLAGFISTPQLWEEFSEEWKEICDRDPKTPDFKMRKAARLKEYNWTEAERDARIQELVDLTRRKAKYRVDAVVARPNYENIVRGKIPHQIDDPYFMLFYSVILAMPEFLDLIEWEGAVDFVFDKQNLSVEKNCVGWYDWIRGNVASNIKKRMGSTPIFLHDTDVLPLKAADIFAWQIRRHLDSEQPLQVPHNDVLDSILGIHGVSCNLRGEDLENLVAVIQHGVLLQKHAQYFLPNTQAVMQNVRKRNLHIDLLRD